MSTSCLTVSQTIDLFLVACQANGLSSGYLHPRVT